MDHCRSILLYTLPLNNNQALASTRAALFDVKDALLTRSSGVFGHVLSQRVVMRASLFAVLAASLGCLQAADRVLGADSTASASISTTGKVLQPSKRLPMPRPPPPLQMFDFDSVNETISLADQSWSSTVARGHLVWPHVRGSETPPATFTVLAPLVSQDEVAALLAIVRNTSIEFDEDSDSVDRMSTHEFYLESSGGIDALASVHGKPDKDAAIFEARRPIRERLAALTRPIIQQRVVPFVNEHVPACGGAMSAFQRQVQGGAPPAVGSAAIGNARGGVGCTVCQSLVRRWRDGERLTHGTHFDVQALVTVVVSLSAHDVDYSGGLFLTTGAASAGGSGPVFLPLQPGEAVVHQSDLLHGVRVVPPRGNPGKAPERWSWIMWLKDGADCGRAAVAEWALEGAQRGNAVAQFLQAKRSPSAAERQHYLRLSAAGGLTLAANELAMELLGGDVRAGAGSPARNASAVREAEALMRLAANRGEPDAIYNLGSRAAARGNVSRALSLFLKAANLGSADAAFNVAVSAYSGKGGVEQDLDVAAAWFEVAGTAQSWYLNSRIAAVGTPTTAANATAARLTLERAAKGGYVDACLQLAQESLQGGNPNPRKQEAVRWLQCAARGGNQQAETMLRQLAAS